MWLSKFCCISIPIESQSLLFNDLTRYSLITFISFISFESSESRLLVLATTILTEQKHAALIICAKEEALMNMDSQVAWMTLIVWPVHFVERTGSKLVPFTAVN